MAFVRKIPNPRCSVPETLSFSYRTESRRISLSNLEASALKGWRHQRALLRDVGLDSHKVCMILLSRHAPLFDGPPALSAGA